MHPLNFFFFSAGRPAAYPRQYFLFEWLFLPDLSAETSPSSGQARPQSISQLSSLQISFRRQLDRGRSRSIRVSDRVLDRVYILCHSSSSDSVPPDVDRHANLPGKDAAPNQVNICFSFPIPQI
ncbi:hypothetical protein TWF225_011578 [Orbilia oligospora]|nr:hypothetical protein TWF751_002251 [Orbilia oligospora]KAF3192773.1 hypothetical protein TWF225_011578 [Orbilia oligospora]KAF3238320.1 hypothetical protein TWF128_000652 [Orbilia oligospora]KAF3262886.1 hypothetical protein TWF217_004167 [Orbilia oligospora]KAF3287150.1 hypothetical protein TWF132_008678 [Orbilia oligospora]